MTNLYATPSHSDSEGSESEAETAFAATRPADTAADQAAHVGETAAHAAGEVADVTKTEAGKVATETKKQAKDLMKDARSQLTEQAGEQQARVAEGLRSISDELTQMATASDADGVATDFVRQAASRAGNVATWLDDRDPGSLLEEVRSYARRKPGTFIALAAAAGILAGRLTRSVAAESTDDAPQKADRVSGDPARDLTDDALASVHTREANRVPGLIGGDPDLAVPER